MDTNTFVLLVLIGTAIGTILVRNSDALANVNVPRLVLFCLFVVIGLWLLSIVDEALVTHKISCGRSLKRHMCSELSDPFGFWLSAAIVSIGGVLAFSISIAALLPAKSSDSQ